MKPYDMNNSRIEYTIGILSICVWLMYLKYVPPFTNYPIPTDPSVQNAVHLSIAKAYLMIVVGVLGGYLLLKGKKAGRHITIAISTYMVAGRLFAAFSHKGGVLDWIKIIYKDLLIQSPVPIIHKDIVAPLVFVFSIIFIVKSYSGLIKRRMI